MKRFFILMAVAVIFVSFAPFASAQEHGQVGAFASYLDLGDTGNTNFAGLGGRVLVNFDRYIGVEAEMSYDFEQTFSEGYTNPTTAHVTVVQSNLSVLDGLFGPVLQTGHGPFRVFVTVKGGFINFRLNPESASFNSFTSSVSNLRSSDVSAVLYPGGGVEAHLGPVGLRLDVGDEIYFNNGTYNNLRVTFGPIIRF